MLFSFTSGHYKGLSLLELYAFGSVKIRSLRGVKGGYFAMKLSIVLEIRLSWIFNFFNGLLVVTWVQL